ncbi:DUF998 domain-containing protein [Amycolatopsis sp. NPDC101161]|uniref:DUF998 domain-containing protein n=1 Tax=Amycolatopsis sp. NPDC101161 TaxID=3363940 RepID=UPI00380CD5B4
MSLPVPSSTFPALLAGRRCRVGLVTAQVVFAVAGGLLAVLHVDPRWGPINPMTGMLSDYAWCPGWWMWDTALVLIAAGSAVVLAVLHRRRVLVGRPAVSAMVVWCLSVLAVAVFSKDPQGGAVTATGKAHLGATAISCVSLPLAGWLLGRRHRHEPSWRRSAAWSRRLALATIPFFLPFIVPFTADVVLGGHLPTVATGLVERAMAALELALLVVLARWVRPATAGDALDSPPSAT